MKSHVWRYYLISSFFAAARMGIGATSVTYMLSTGASLRDVATTKIVQALVVFFAEIPTGLIADTFGRRSSLFFAALTSIASVAVFGASATVIGFSVAEILNGLAISFWSGAFEAIAVEDTRHEVHGNYFMEFFFSRMSTYNAFATMLGGLAGGWLGASQLLWPFYLSGGLMLVTLILMIVLLPHEKISLELHIRNIKSPNIADKMREFFKEMSRHYKNAWHLSLENVAVRQFFFDSNRYPIRDSTDASLLATLF